MARPSKQDKLLTPANIDKIRQMIANGVSEEQVSKWLGIAYSTFREWKNNNPQLQAVLKESREISNNLVENALFKRAIGYEFTEVTKELKQTSNGKMAMVVTKQVVKNIPPDTTAQIFWLKNHMPDKYVDKQVQDVNLNNEAVDQLKEMSKRLLDETE